VKPIAKFVAALAAFFALYTIRTWYVLGGAFFGVVLLRGGYALTQDDADWPAAVFMLAAGLVLLGISFRWFAMRWHEAAPGDPPAA
jgi:hypothetical protein